MKNWYVYITLTFDGVRGVESTQVQLTIKADSIGDAISIAQHHMSVLRGSDFDFKIDKAF